MPGDQESTTTTQQPPSPQAQFASQRRRSSFAELFASRAPNDPSSATTSINASNSSPRPVRHSQAFMSAAFGGESNQINNGQQSQPGAASSSAQQIQPRRLSITTLGLSGSPTRSAATATSPFGALRRGQSVSEQDSRRSSDFTESAVSDDLDGTSPPPQGNSPPFSRRVSFGARAAYRDMRSISTSGPSPGSGGMGDGGGGPTGNDNETSASAGPLDGAAAATTTTASSESNGNRKAMGSTSPPSNSFKEGFNWSESIRARAARGSISSGGGGHTRQPSITSSMIGASASGTAAVTMMGGPSTTSASSSSSSAATAAAPAPAKPPAQPARKAPDHFQERILKGDFYMD